jgi:hypothetical protein
MKKIDPIKEGIARFINHNKMVDKIIPIRLLENSPIKKIAREPFIPNSAMVVVGMRVVNK